MIILVDVRHLQDKQKTGVGEYTTELLRALFEMDEWNEYELFSSGTSHVQTDFSPVCTAGAEVTKVTRNHVSLPNKLLKLLTSTTGLPRFDRFAKAKPDLIWFPNLNFVGLGRGLPCPYILTIHDLSWKIFPEFFSTRMRLWHAMARPNRLVQNAAAIIVPSEATKQDVVHFFQKPADQIHVIPHGVDPKFCPEFQSTDHGVRGKYKLPKRFALFVGTLEPRKNVIALIDAIDTYRRDTGDNLHLVLAGGWGWKSAKIRKHLRFKGTLVPSGSRVSTSTNGTKVPGNSWIHHLGYIPRQDLPALYRAATVFTWPSIYEGFGLPVLEAMASGCPIITSNTSSLPELTGNAAILVNPLRPTEITQALEQLLSSSALNFRLLAAGLERAKQYSWNTAAEKTLNLFTKSIS